MFCCISYGSLMKSQALSCASRSLRINYVFNSQKSIQLSRITVFKLFREIARKAGLGETLQHPSILKHTAAMLLVQQGANAFLIRQALGHKSFGSTLAYVNPSDADASAALAKAFHQAL